ncbi:hypothetical protein [Microbacterium sp. NPDC055683]
MTPDTPQLSHIPPETRGLLADAEMYAAYGRDDAFVGYVALHQPDGIVPLARLRLLAIAPDAPAEAHLAADLARYPHEMREAYEVAGESWPEALLAIAQTLLAHAHARVVDVEDEGAAR